MRDSSLLSLRKDSNALCLSRDSNPFYVCHSLTRLCTCKKAAAETGPEPSPILRGTQTHCSNFTKSQQNAAPTEKLKSTVTIYTGSAQAILTLTLFLYPAPKTQVNSNGAGNWSLGHLEKRGSKGNGLGAQLGHRTVWESLLSDHSGPLWQTHSHHPRLSLLGQELLHSQRTPRYPAWLLIHTTLTSR